MLHAAESAHWYTRSGEVAYTVTAKDGSQRPTTLRDARKLSLVPSVTTIIKCAAAPGLQYWMQKQVMLAALTLPKVAGETEDAYLARILNDSKEQARKAAERGTAIHACLQAFYQKEPWGEYSSHVIGANNALNAHFGMPIWMAEKSFSHCLGFGGKVDICSKIPYAEGLVCDFKTKEFSEGDDLKTWEEQAMQLAAYRHGLGLEKARCAIVYVSTTVPGLCKLIEIPQEDLAKGWTMFYSLLHYWQAKNVYRSSFNLEAVAA